MCFIGYADCEVNIDVDGDVSSKSSLVMSSFSLYILVLVMLLNHYCHKCIGILHKVNRWEFLGFVVWI